MYRHIHAHGVRDWTRPGRVPAAPELHFQPRYVLPVRRAGTLLALVMIIEGAAGELSAAQTGDAARAAAQMAGVLEGPRARRDEARAGRNALLDALVSDRDELRDGALTRAATTFAGPGDRIRLLAVDVAPAGAGPAGPDTTRPGQLVEAAVDNIAVTERPRPEAVVHGARGMAVTVERAGAAPADPVRSATRVVAAVGALAGPDATVTAGLPGATTDVAGMRRAWRRARVAADAARRLPRLGPVVSWADLGVHRSLLRLSRDELEDAVPDGLRALLEHDPRGTLRATLTTYLDEAGSSAATARALTLHRTSLYYRLDRIADRTGLDLHDGSDRLALHLGLRALDLLDADPAP